MKRDPSENMTDQELLDRYYADRDNAWLGILLPRYTLLLLGVCMKYLKQEEEARDAVQQIFMKVITELAKYRVEYFKSWIYTIARNHCLMKLRDQHGRPTALKEEMMAAWDEETAKGQHLAKDQMLDLMVQSLDELGKEQKQCVILFYLQKKSYQEIAAVTNFSAMQVKSYIQNGKRNLKLLMEKKAKEKSKTT